MGDISQIKPLDLMAKNNLARLPKIIEYLEERGFISVEQAADIRTAIKEKTHPGKFVGDIMVEKGYLTRESIDEQLAERAFAKCMAATDDIRFLVKNGELPLEEWQNPHFGNHNSVNDLRQDLTRHSAAAITANIVRLVVILSAKSPSVANDPEIVEGVISARNIVDALVHGDSAFAPIKLNAETWLSHLKNALTISAEANEIDADKLALYTQARFAEIKEGIAKIS